MKKLRTAIIGLAHVHVKMLSYDFAKYSDRVEIVGMADVPPYTKEELETRISLNVPEDLEMKLYDDYKTLLNENIDIAVICTDVKDHAAIVEETLAMGIYTVVEKPMALSMEDAKRMYRAYKKSTAELIINWPVAWFPAYRKAKELAKSGAVGEILRVQYRSPSTRGPYGADEYSAAELSKLWWYKHDRGGGSICDYAGYGCVLTTWITEKLQKEFQGSKRTSFCRFPMLKITVYSPLISVTA